MNPEKTLFQNPYPGVFVVVEGIDCCGKSTQAARIHNWASAYTKMRVAPLTKEPTISHYGKRIRRILCDKILFQNTDPFDLQDLFAKDSRLHCKDVIMPALMRGEFICSDRFRPSMVFGAEKGNLMDLDALMEMNVHYLGPHFVWPKVIIIFDLPPDLAIQRGKKAGRKFDEMEKLERLDAVRENYKIFAERYPNCHIVPVFKSVAGVVQDRSEEEIFVDVRQILEKVLENKVGKS